eukprot:6203993-Pleurochrysis_carterae.AAC.3
MIAHNEAKAKSAGNIHMLLLNQDPAWLDPKIRSAMGLSRPIAGDVMARSIFTVEPILLQPEVLNVSNESPRRALSTLQQCLLSA